MTIGSGSAIVTGATKSHPLTSVTVTVYEPAHRPTAVSVTVPAGSSHKNVNGAVPPTIVTKAEPSQTPLQVASVAVAVAVRPTGLFTVPEVISVHPLASVTSTLYVPAQRSIAVAVVWLRGSSHK